MQRSRFRTWIGLMAPVVLLLVAAACARQDFDPGDPCELNNDCAAPLICRLGRCRVECRAARDCAAGLSCVRDDMGLGACQLPSETECSLASDCPEVLVCRFGRCTNACEDDIDCPPGARCLEDESGARGCRDDSMMECELNSDCMELYICAVDGRCREECRKDPDCRDGLVCLVDESPPVCGRPESTPDGGLDGGALDAGDGDAGSLDGGAPDGGPPDGGFMAPPAAPRTLAGGRDHSCATDGAQMRCWGSNTNGQLGDGTTSPRTGLVDVVAGAVLVGTGALHTCATTAAELRCWGDSTNGQVGTGVTGANVTTPTAVAGLPAVPVDLALGNDHTCAVASGSVYCWGANGSGQLGVAGGNRSAPVQVTALGGTAVNVSAVGDHTCALLADATIACWGSNTNGQLGVDSGAIASSSTPLAVAGLGPVAQVAAGTTFTCALLIDGTVSCWGANFSRQLGDGTMVARHTPAPTSPIGEPALGLTLGSGHACVRLASGVSCWGENSSFQLGRMTPLVLSAPTDIGVGAVDQVVAGRFHTCLAEAGFSLRCAGDNGGGALDGTPGPTTPTFLDVGWP